MINGSYRGDSGRRGWTTESDLLAGQRTDEGMIAEMIREDRRRLLIATLNGSGAETIVGCVSIERTVREATASLGMLTVDVDEQKSGLGDFLLRTAENQAREQLGAKFMQMHVISVRSELIAWYERRGYSATGETAAFPYGDERFGIPLRPDLRFAVLEKAL